MGGGSVPPADNWSNPSVFGVEAGPAFATVRALATTYDHNNDPLTPDISIPGGIEVNGTGGSGTLTITAAQPPAFDLAPNNLLTLTFWAARQSGGSETILVDPGVSLRYEPRISVTN